MTNQQSKFVSSKIPVANNSSIFSPSTSVARHEYIEEQEGYWTEAAEELASLYAFLIQICLNGSNALEQRSIAHFILSQFVSNPELEKLPGIYSFLSSSSQMHYNTNSISNQIIVHNSPRKSTKHKQQGDAERRLLLEISHQKRGNKMVPASSELTQSTSKGQGISRRKSTTTNKTKLTLEEKLSGGDGNGGKKSGGKRKEGRSKSHHHIFIGQTQQQKPTKTNKLKSGTNSGQNSSGPSSPRHGGGIIKKKSNGKAVSSKMIKSKSAFSLLPSASTSSTAITNSASIKRRRPGTMATISKMTTTSFSSPPPPSYRPNTTADGGNLRRIHSLKSNPHQGDKEEEETDLMSNSSSTTTMKNRRKVNNNGGNGAEMLQRLFRAIELANDALAAIVLCRLLQGYIKNCKMAVAQRRLRLCAKLDGTSHCLRAIKAQMERQRYLDDRELLNGMSIGQFALDNLARTVLCVAGKDRKFALKIRLNGMLPTLAANVLLPSFADTPISSMISNAFSSINLLRLAARCLRSNRNALLFGKERNFAQRFVLTLNATLALESEQNIAPAYPSSTSFILSMADQGPPDEFLLASFLTTSNSTGNVGAAKMARLVECLFFLTKNKRNKTQLSDNHCIPVLKTIFEANFQRRRQDLVHQEIALISLASLRQFAKTKKGRDQLMSLSTLDMCEKFIEEMAKEEKQNHQLKGKVIAPELDATMASSNAQLQDSLCALCLRCLPAQQFPYELDEFPIKFSLPKTTPLPKTEPKRRKSMTPNVKQKSQKSSPQIRKRRGMNEEDEDGHSSDEDYGFWSAATTGAEMAMGLGEDSMMSCSGGVTDGNLSSQIGCSEEGDEDEENLDESKDQGAGDGKPPLGSARAVEQYNRQQPAELILNYQKMFAEFTNEGIDAQSISDEFTVSKESIPHSPGAILSHEQIVRKYWMLDSRHQMTRSVVPFIKIAYPELLDCADQSMPSLNSFGNAANSGQLQRHGNDALVKNMTASPESMRQLIVQKMANHYRNQQQQKSSKNEMGGGGLFKRRIIFDLDELMAAGQTEMPTNTLDNSDAQCLGKFVEKAASDAGGNGGHLRFESRFESGNLRKAVQVGPTEYELVLAPDINQHSAHFQWFHFEVSGVRRSVSYTFEIVNCLKPVSMFSRGMQPVLFSVAEAMRHGRPGWVRAGTQISYFRNLYAVPEPKTSKEGEKAEGNTQKDEFFPSTPRRRTRSATAAKATAISVGSAENGKIAHFKEGTLAKNGKEKMMENKTELETRNFFSLRFTLKFPHDGDICYIAYHFPYTYTRLQCTLERWISTMTSQNESGNCGQMHICRQFLCHSLARVPIPLLTITNNSNAIQSKQIVFITARVHPGETNSSWIMHGLIQFLLSNHPLAWKAREHFVFKLIPMLNPDGVINGSHRCSLAGQDLNRVWNDPQPNLHPTIFHAKGILQYAVDVLRKPPFAFIDLHGHSRKANIFMYGNNPEESWRQSDHQNSKGQAQPQFSMLPEILDKISDSFALKDCAFSITKPKEYSARVACWRQFGLERVYTMESSYWGFDQGPKAGTQVSIADLKRMGAELIEGLVQLYEITASTTTMMAPMAFPEDEE